MFRRVLFDPERAAVKIFVCTPSILGYPVAVEAGVGVLSIGDRPAGEWRVDVRALFVVTTKDNHDGR